MTTRRRRSAASFASAAEASAGASHVREVNTAIATVRQKKICASPAWPIEMASGSK